MNPNCYFGCKKLLDTFVTKFGRALLWCSVIDRPSSSYSACLHLSLLLQVYNFCFSPFIHIPQNPIGLDFFEHCHASHGCRVGGPTLVHAVWLGRGLSWAGVMWGKWAGVVTGRVAIVQLLSCVCFFKTP